MSALYDRTRKDKEEQVFFVIKRFENLINYGSRMCGIVVIEKFVMILCCDH